jgi:hypothetical protein
MTDTLREILDRFKMIDDDLPPEDFDPAVVVGDVKDKVDAIKWRIDSWEAEAEAVGDWIKALSLRQRSLAAKAEKLSSYLKQQMIENEFQKLPGNIWRAQVQRIADKVEILKEAGAEDVLSDTAAPFVKQVINYTWDKKAIADALKEGKALPFAYAKENKSLRFYVVNKEDKKS